MALTNYGRILELKALADADPNYTNRCIACKEKVVFQEGEKALTEGHVYSDAGKQEYANTRICEWCFDEATVWRDELP